jgi:hypothetical protein
MKAVKSSSCALALLVGFVYPGCGDDDEDTVTDAGSGTEDAGGGTEDAGGGTEDAGGGTEDAGGGAEDAGGKYELTGEVGPVEGTGTECSAISDTSDEGGCYGFFCGTNSNSINEGLTSDSPCDTTAQVWLICDGLGAREASRCARVHALDDDPREGTRMCLRDNSDLDPFTDACLACFLDSADCAREQCLTECLGGDSDTCDACREENGCTPTYYECSGLPNPQ